MHTSRAMRSSLGGLQSLSRRYPSYGTRWKLMPVHSFSTSQILGSNNQSSTVQPEMNSEEKKIHILGIGNIGTFVAHALGSLQPRPPITLLFPMVDLLKTWDARTRTLTVRRNGLDEYRRGYNINVMQDNVWYSPSEIIDSSPGMLHDEEKQFEDEKKVPADDEIITNLIVTVKTTQMNHALNSVRHRLTPDSTILFLHNGMGVIEEVNEKIFPDITTRPNYLCGITSHGIHRSGPFLVTHAGVGTTTIGLIHSNRQQDSTKQQSPHDAMAPSSAYLLDTFTRAPELTAVEVNKTELLLLQLEKLAINCVVNPLTVMGDCKNGDLLYNYSLSRVQRLLLIEISTVICALPELQGVPGIQSRFSPERLRTLSVGVMRRTSSNISSMLQDMRIGKETEINYMNGYIVRRGEELGIKCALNYMLVQLVEGKSRMVGKKISGEIPFEVGKI